MLMNKEQIKEVIPHKRTISAGGSGGGDGSRQIHRCHQVRH